MKIQRVGDFFRIEPENDYENEEILRFFEKQEPEENIIKIPVRMSDVFGIREFPHPLPQALRILLLDNSIFSANIVERIRKKTGALQVWHNAKVVDCLHNLSCQDWDEVYLEHDLKREFQDPDDPTSGMELVRYLGKTGWPENKRKPIFRIISTNIFAAWMMVKALQAQGFIAVWQPEDV